MSNFISIKWDRFLAEGEAEHFPWLKELQATNDLKEIQAIVESDRFKKIGGGSFRKVYEPVGDPEYVIKVIHDPDKYKMQMNKDDFETAKRYPFIFPKAYAHADDFSWIVIENTRPVTWPSQMQKVLDQSFPKEQEVLLKVADELQFNPADPFHIMKMIMASFRDDRSINEVASAAVAAARASLLQQVLPPVAGPAYQELSKAMHEFEIDKYEINRGNIGHDEDYNFKIIDSSVFSSEWDDDLEEALNEGAEEEPDLIKFSEELNDRISSLLFSPASIEHLNQQTAGGEVTTVLDTGELFANYETLNEVHLGIAINDQAQGDIKAFYLCEPEDRSQSNLVIVLNIPREYDKVEGFQEWLTEELEDALSHELQHSCDSTEMLTGDIPEGEAKWESLENIYKHFASDAETRGHLAGARGRVRRSGADINEIVTGKVNLIFDEALERGYSKEELMPVMQAIWEKWNNYLAGWSLKENSSQAPQDAGKSAYEQIVTKLMNWLAQYKHLFTVTDNLSRKEDTWGGFDLVLEVLNIDQHRRDWIKDGSDPPLRNFLMKKSTKKAAGEIRKKLEDLLAGQQVVISRYRTFPDWDAGHEIEGRTGTITEVDFHARNRPLIWIQWDGDDDIAENLNYSKFQSVRKGEQTGSNYVHSYRLDLVNPITLEDVIGTLQE